jgi:hypothetical protein
VRTDPIDMQALQDELCGYAVQIADECYKIKLDYSVDSIRQVEAVLADVHEEYQRTGAEEGLGGVALNFGAYIAATIARHLGPARWEADHPEFGEGTFPLYCGDTTVFPVSWCEKRIYDGPGDDLWFKFQALLNHRERNPAA